MEITNNSTDNRKRLQKGQGLAEYSLIIALVAVVCVTILIMLGKGTKSTIYKVTCAVGSTDSQCKCINEKLTVTSTWANTLPGCNVNNLVVTVTSSCTGSSLKVGGLAAATTPASITWTNAPVCMGGATTFTVQSTQPDGTVKSYQASRP